jgi:ABC-type sugar transport system substrate-binding protein
MRRWIVAPVLVAALACLLAACGGSKSSSSSATATNAAASASGTSTGTGAAASAGPKVALPKETIGLVDIVGASSADQALEQSVKQAAQLLGWSYKSVDAQGDPAKMNGGVLSFVNQHVNAIVTIAIQPQAARQGLAAAKAAGIPTIQIGGTLPPSDLYTASYEQNEGAMTDLAAQYMVDRMHFTGDVGFFTNNAVYGFKARQAAFDAVLSLYPGIHIVATHELDLTNLGPDAQSATVAMLQAHPSIKAIWVMADPAFIPALDGVRQAGHDSKTFVMGWTAYPPYGKALVNDPAAGALPHAYSENTGWVAMDQLASHFAKHTAIDPEAVADNPVPVTLFTKEHPPPTNTVPTPPVNYQETYGAKWKAEYTLSNG